MGKYRKLLAAILIGGVLLGGVGTGIALAEYASLEYTGQQNLTMGELVTKDFTLDIPAGCTVEDPFCLDIYHYGNDNRFTIVEDASLALGTLTLQVTYSQDSVTPIISVDEMENVLSLFWEYHGPGDLAQLLALKDQVLADLKDRKISDYMHSYVEQITLTVNPVDRERIAY